MAYVDEVLADNPLIYWRLDETSGNTFADSSGNGRNGTWAISGIQKGQSPLLNNQPAGYSALIPASTVNSIGTATVGDLTTGRTGLTFEAWIKIGTAIPLTTGATVLIMNGVEANRAQGIGIGSGGAFQFSASSNTSGTSFNTSSTITASLNQTYHFVGVIEDIGSSVEVRIYVDGVLVGSQTRSQTDIFATTNGNVRVGAASRSNTLQIDEAAIYGSALSASRILAHYNAGIAPAYFAPTNTAAPSISGTAKVGQTLTTTDGTWSADPSPTYAYAWEQSDNGTSGWSTISGATSSTYTLAAGQSGKYARAKVTATNSEGSATATTGASAQITENPAVSTPTITGTAKVGQTLTASASATAGYPTPSLTYQWQTSSNGSTWSTISGATSATYALTDANAGKQIRAQATATNSEGTDTKASSASAAVLQNPVVSTPTISGEARVGETLTAAASASAGYPAPSISYQWQSSADNGANWISLTGATSLTLTLTSTQAGQLIRVQASATNSEGTDTEASEATDPILWDPANTALPSISYPANLEVGETLTATEGSWTGYPAPDAFDVQWEISDDGSTGWEEIADETELTLVLTSAMTTRYARARISTTTDAGSATAYSVTTGFISEDPASIVAPSIAGIDEVGETLAVEPGEWTGFPNPDFTFAWQVSATGSTEWETISGEDGEFFMNTEAEAGLFIRSVVTGTNDVGSASAASNVIGPILQGPFMISFPEISGEALIGETLTLSLGSWGGYQQPDLTVQWKVWSIDHGDFTPLVGETGTTLNITEALFNRSVIALVTATNQVGSVSAESESVGPIDYPAAAPTFINLPEIVGIAQVGESLLGSEGAALGYPEPIFSFQWERRIDEQWEEIDGAQMPSYEITGEDLGTQLRLKVTAENIAGEATVYSSETETVIPENSAPILINEPTISGTFEVNTVITSTSGTYEGYPEPEVSGAWHFYGSQMLELPEWLEPVASNELYLEQRMVGMWIRWKETASNSEGEVEAMSQSREIIPPISKAPTILPVSNARIVKIIAPGLNGMSIRGYDSEFLPDTYENGTLWKGDADAYLRSKVNSSSSSGRYDIFKEVTVLIPYLVEVPAGSTLIVWHKGNAFEYRVTAVEEINQDPGLPKTLRCYIEKGNDNDAGI